MNDHNLYFTDQDAGDDVTANGSGKNFTKSIPLGVVRNISIGKGKLYIEAVVKTILAGAGDSVDIDLCVSTDEAGTANVAVIAQTILQFPAVSPAGVHLSALVPESSYNSNVFLQEKAFLFARSYGRGSGASESGNIVCCLTLEPAHKHIYPSATSV